MGPRCNESYFFGSLPEDGNSARLQSMAWVDKLPKTIFWPVRVILHLFSGRRRPGDLQQCAEAHAGALQCQLVVLSLDVAVDPLHGDLSRPSTQRYWVLRTLDGFVFGFVVGPPCETYSRARFHLGGPPPLRSGMYPFGILGISRKHHLQVSAGSAFANFSICLSGAALTVGARGVLEHPAPFELPDSTCIWKNPLMQKLLLHPGAELVEINQSDYGQLSIKPTGLLGLHLHDFRKVLREARIPPLLRKAKRLKMGCQLENGLFTTAPLKEYPVALCDAIASALLNTVPSSTPSSCPSESAEWRERFSSFLQEMEHMNCALPSSEGEMRPDYQGQRA